MSATKYLRGAPNDPACVVPRRISAMADAESHGELDVHILLLNLYYPPDTSATAKMAAEVAEALAARHDVTVLAGRPSYDPAERRPFRLLQRETRNGVVVERVGSTAFPRYRMSRRAANYLSYLALAIPRALFLRADLILAMTDPPVEGIAGACVAALRRRPFVYNIRDLYPDMALGGGILRPSAAVRLWERLHRRALRRATRVIVLGEDMRDRIVSKGIDPVRVEIVRDGAAIPDAPPPADHALAAPIRCGFPFVALHAGNLGFYGAWDTLLAAARQLEDGSGLVLVGDGAERARLQAAANGCARVRFLPYRPPAEIPYVLAAGDVHVVTVRRGLEGVVVPSKLYPILAAGRPVLAVAPPECDVVRIVRARGCGEVADPDDPASVAAAIHRLRADPVRLAQMGTRAREIAPDYGKVKQLERFVAVVERAARER